MKKLLTYDGVDKQNRESLLDKIYDSNKPKKQSTKEMFKKMTEFFFKNLCNCKK